MKKIDMVPKYDDFQFVQGLEGPIRNDMNEKSLYLGGKKMTIYGALNELKNLLKADDIPFYYRPSIKAVIDTIELSSSENPNKWIWCKDRLPEETGWIICTNGKNNSVERYKTDAMDHFYPNGRWFEVEDMIAWMPLPSLPKEVKNESNRHNKTR